MKVVGVKRMLALGACVGFILLSAPCRALDGLIVDGSTGKPLAGVYVIGAWWTSMPMAAVPKSGCAKLEVARSDGRGRFTLSKWSGSVLTHFFGTENLNVYYYMRGYRWDKGYEVIGETVVMVPDNRSSLEQLGKLEQVTADADCGSRAVQQEHVLPLYRLLYGEARAIANTSSVDERKALSNLLFMIEVLEIGYERASKNGQDRLFRGYQ